MIHSPSQAGFARQQGFSLVELLVTLVVAAIMLAFAVPTFSRLLMNNSLTSQTNEMLAGLKLARSEAARRGIPVALRTESSFEAGWKVITDEDGDGNLPSTVTDKDGTPLREQGAATAGVTIKRVDFADDAYTDATGSGSEFIVFNARGGVAATSFFRVCSSTITSIPGRIIQVNVVGKVAVISSNANCTPSSD